MLKIHVEATDLWDYEKEEFIHIKEQTLTMEHSLVSISKWESKYQKPFLVKDPPKTQEEERYYFQCMTLTQNVDPVVFLCLSNSNVKAIADYIGSSMTATTFTNLRKNAQAKGMKEKIITSEIIYYWMISFGIPFECQRWPLSRLLTLIRVCAVKNDSNNKMSKKDTYDFHRQQNAIRRARSKGRVKR